MHYNPKKHYKTKSGNFRTANHTLRIIETDLNGCGDIAGVLLDNSSKQLAVWSASDSVDSFECTLCDIYAPDEMALVEDVLTENVYSFYIVLFSNGEMVAYKTKEDALYRKARAAHDTKVLEIPDGQYKLVTCVD